jgi:hypothetical protein
MSALYYLYRNLHTGTFSLKHQGKVISRPSTVVMDDCVFKVSEKGRQRVLDEQVKNVHAMIGCQSYRENVVVAAPTTWEELHYDPYKTPNFCIKSTGEPIESAKQVYGFENKIYAWKNDSNLTKGTSNVLVGEHSIPVSYVYDQYHNIVDLNITNLVDVVGPVDFELKDVYQQIKSFLDE